MRFDRLKTVVALAVGAGVGFMVACGGGPKDYCVERNIKCDTPLACDPNDGKCKCGGRGGVECQPGFICDATANTCLSTNCKDVVCTAGTSCDVTDGKCKCGGTGGPTCESGTVCNPQTKACVPAVSCTQVACPLNQACDAATGRCKCGTAECAPGKACSIDTAQQKLCVDDACSGKTCSGANACDKTDGMCKCNGIVCASGDACSCPDGGVCDQAERSCRPGTSCAGKPPCPQHMVCDPTDGRCKCGGPGGPVCVVDGPGVLPELIQICSLGPPPQCMGGQQCTAPDGGPKTCAGGSSCDPEDGKCKCGGRNGRECKPADGVDPAEICVSSQNQHACRRPCDPRAPDCPAGTYCFFDSLAAVPAAYCAAPTDTRGPAQSCTTATACFVQNPPKALNCTGLAPGTSGICRSYCDVAAGTAGCIQVPVAQTCEQIQGAPAGYGYCKPV